MIGGDPGIRLIEPVHTQGVPYFEDIPEPFAREQGFYLVVPFSHVFGSDELSMLTPGVRERAPAASLAMSPSDMADAHMADGDSAVLSMAGRSYALTVKAVPGLPSGVAAVPCGVPGAPVLTIPAFGQVEKAIP
jgi:NADH-quinone oxidoreductase subunit G